MIQGERRMARTSTMVISPALVDIATRGCREYVTLYSLGQKAVSLHRIALRITRHPSRCRSKQQISVRARSFHIVYPYSFGISPTRPPNSSNGVLYGSCMHRTCALAKK
ncbi:unnamed protein product [Sphacelaria rigidula]